nr:DUF6446 family protein [uncultured Ruegeria sp.]
MSEKRKSSAGKVLVAILLMCAAIAGISMYYLQIYGFYYDVEAKPGKDVVLTEVETNQPVAINYSAFQAIDADSSPIRYRACFETELTLEDLSAAFMPADDPEPLTAPGWFDCYDALAVADALKTGHARAYVAIKNVHFGVDRIVAVTDGGQGYVWHRLNNCGEKAYDGTVVGEECPPRPQE